MRKRIDKEKFISLLKDNQILMVGGFLLCGTPEILIDWVVESKVRGLTIIGNDAGYPEKGVGKLIASGQVKKIIASHIGTNPNLGKLMSEEKIEVILSPQGTIVEQIRAHGAGLGGVLTQVGLHTTVEKGKRIITVNNVDYLLEEPLRADLALISAHKSDALGNLTYAKTARNFNPMMAISADKVIAYIDLEVDFIDPEHVITPHTFVDYVVGGENFE